MQTPVLEIGKPVMVPTVMLNIGKTPAFHLTGGTAVHLGPNMPIDELLGRAQIVMQTIPIEDGVLFPGNELPFLHAIGDPLTGKQLELIRSDKLLIYVLGDIAYSDQFDRTHHTKSCLVYFGQSDTVKICTKHNHAD